MIIVEWEMSRTLVSANLETKLLNILLNERHTLVGKI